MYRLLVLVLLPLLAHAQPRTDAFLAQLLRQQGNGVLKNVLADKDSFQVQIIYTQINRDAHNKPHFTNYYFNYDPQLYFNPASMVKLPLALLSLEKINNLHKKGVTKFTTIQYDSSQPWQHPLYRDTTARSGRPSIAHFIKRAFLISENDPYNRMYQFVGQQQTNRLLHQKGYADARITRQFLGLTANENRYTNAVHFIDSNGKTIYAQPAAYNTDSFDFSHTILLGKGYHDRNDSLVNQPFDFTQHNNLSLGTLQQLLQSTLFPQSVPQKQRFHLSPDDYAFLYRYLSQAPSETDDPKYDTTVFWDNYVKFFFLDSTRHLPPGVRVFNKVGWAYGFLTDVSYVADFKNNIEYMLSATVYVNSDGILNDDTYDFETVGHPFMYQLGQLIYHYEKQRPRRYKPNLSRFIINYGKRDPSDMRPSLRDVDN